MILLLYRLLICVLRNDYHVLFRIGLTGRVVSHFIERTTNFNDMSHISQILKYGFQN